MHSNLTQEFNELRNDYYKVILLNTRFADRNLKDMDRMFELEQQLDALRVELAAVKAERDTALLDANVMREIWKVLD